MIRVDVEQGSPEWLAVRLGIPTASQFRRIMTSKTMKPSSSSEGYLHELLAEWLIQEPLDEKKSQLMERGNELEQTAVSYYEFQRDIETEIVGFCLRDDRMVGCSPDRFIGNDGGLEIKCPSAKVHVEYLLNGSLSDEYRLQVQGNLWITGRQWWDIMSYNPVLPPALIRCERDEEFISILSGLVDAFVARLQGARLTLSEKGITPIQEKLTNGQKPNGSPTPAADNQAPLEDGQAPPSEPSPEPAEAGRESGKGGEKEKKTAELEKFRAAVLKLDPLCRNKLCPNEGTAFGAAVDAHHLIKRSQGGTDSVGNGIGLCRNCHFLVENGGPFNDEKRKAKEIELEILEQWLETPDWRWDQVYEQLRKKEPEKS